MKKKELSIKQKNADKDLNIIVLFTLIPLIIYLVFGNSIMNFAKKGKNTNKETSQQSIKYMVEIYSNYTNSIWFGGFRKFDCHSL